MYVPDTSQDTQDTCKTHPALVVLSGKRRSSQACPVAQVQLASVSWQILVLSVSYWSMSLHSWASYEATRPQKQSLHCSHELYPRPGSLISLISTTAAFSAATQTSILVFRVPRKYMTQVFVCCFLCPDHSSSSICLLGPFHPSALYQRPLPSETSHQFLLFSFCFLLVSPGPQHVLSLCYASQAPHHTSLTQTELHGDLSVPWNPAL